MTGLIWNQGDQLGSSCIVVQAMGNIDVGIWNRENWMDLRTVLEIELLNVETKGEGKTKENCIIQLIKLSIPVAIYLEHKAVFKNWS